RGDRSRDRACHPAARREDRGRRRQAIDPDLRAADGSLRSPAARGLDRRVSLRQAAWLSCSAMTPSATDPHAGQPIRHFGPKPEQARLTAIMVHGRGASGSDILSLAQEFRATDVACLAPEAAGHSWYPYSFLTPMEKNEPGLSSALRVLATLIESLGDRGIS